MAEQIRATGKLEEVSEVGKGTKKDGTEWTRYKYKIDGDIYSGFVNLKEKEPIIEIGEKVQIAYTEKENPKGGVYRNISFIDPFAPGAVPVEDKEVSEANKQYNVKKIGEGGMKEDYPEFLKKLLDHELFLKCLEISAQFAINVTSYVHKDKIDDWFDDIYAYALAKRKQKLGGN